MILSALMKKGWLRELATAIPATGATEEGKKAGTVARVARVAVANPTSHESNDGERIENRAAVDVDRHHEPNVSAAAPTIAPVHRAAGGADIDVGVELIALVDAIADFHGFNPEQRDEAKQIALADLEAALECFRDLAARIPGGPGVQSATDDRIRCNQCANLAGRKCTKWKELGAARGWEPVQLPLRCEQFKPKAGEADQRTGAQRWPELKKVDE